jgi:predicted metal-binding protein
MMAGYIFSEAFVWPAEKERTMNINDRLPQLAIDLGASKAKVVEVKYIPFNPEFRKMCEMNACGKFGKSWMCPPDIGDVNDLIREAKRFTYALVYQTISSLEDSFDIEGMLAAGEKQNNLAAKIKEHTAPFAFKEILHLGAGGCRVCPKCAKADNVPCRFPDQAMSSLEAYGIAVSELAPLAEMKYINGNNTVTFFGALFFNL